MKKMMKKLVASILAIVMCVSTYMAFDWNVAEASQDTLTSDDFKMVGASVRFEDESTVNGIRFGIGIKESVYSDLDATVKNSIRLLVMPTKLVTGDLEIGETYTNGTTTASAIDTAIGTKWELKSYEDESYYVTYVYLYKIDDTCYDFDVTARAYWKADESSEAVYTDAIERSYIYVAEAALNDVATEESTAYPNAVGSNYSPYTAAQRDALIDVPYEQTANTIWDYVDGAFVKQGDDNSDQFIYDRRVDSSKDFKVYFTHTMHTGSYSGQIRFLNFGESNDGAQYYEFDFTQTASDSTDYKVHLRHKPSTGLDYITSSSSTFSGGVTYDFLLDVTYPTTDDTNMYIVLKSRVHGSNSAYSNVISKTLEDPSVEPGDKLGYCLHAESRAASFEIEKGDVYRCNVYRSDGTTSQLASGVSVTELVEGLNISGYTTSGSESYCMLLDRYTQPASDGNANANYTIEVDITCDYTTTSSFAGFIVGYVTDRDYISGAHKRIRLYESKVNVNGTANIDITSSTMGETAYAAYTSNIENNIPNTLKCVFATDQTTNMTTVFAYINGVYIGTCSFADTDINDNRIALTATDNAKFSNLVIDRDSYPVTTYTTQSGINVDEISNELQISGYTADGSETYCTLLNKYAYDKSVYGNNNANFTLSMDVAFEKFTDTSFAGFVVGYHNTNRNGTHTRIRMKTTSIGSDNTTYVELNENTMGTDAYATYLSNINSGIANTLKVAVVTADSTTTMTFSVNGIEVGSYSMDASSIYENRIALTTNTNASFSNLVIE